MDFMRPKFWMVSSLSLVLVFGGGCAATRPTVRVESRTHPQADFAAYKTYAFKGSAEPHDSVYFSSTNQARIRAAIGAELKARGLQPAAEPDLTVAVYLRIAEKKHDKSAPAFDDGSMTYNMAQYYGFNYGYEKSWVGKEQIDYKEGSLVIDVVDTRKKLLVYEGIAVGVLYTGRTDEQVEQRVREAVHGAFKDFPQSKN
jgi:hypothetical protein